MKNTHIKKYLKNEQFRQMEKFVQHGDTSTLRHCIAVTETALLLNEILHIKASDETLIKIGMLHDFYLYDWHEKSDDHKWHGFHHAEKAAQNAAKHFELNEKELDAIRSHMWPLNIFKIPKSKEAWMLCIADKLCSTKETVKGRTGNLKSNSGTAETQDISTAEMQNSDPATMKNNSAEEMQDSDTTEKPDSDTAEKQDSSTAEKPGFKYDLHCHVHEGSSDSAVKTEEFIRILISKGFSGMLITDHDTYDGWRYWEKNLKEKYPDFTVLKGIEYDTADAGHIIVVLPVGTHLPVLEQRGLKVRTLIEIVHKNGGVLGPAHPCGEPFLSTFRTGKFKKDDSIAAEFDFIEGFNACEFERDCKASFALAKKYDKPATGGSDAHHHAGVGMGYSVTDRQIRDENDFIAYIKSGSKPVSGGTRYYGTTRDRLGIFNKTLVYGFWFYNKFETAIHTMARKKNLPD